VSVTIDGACVQIQLTASSDMALAGKAFRKCHGVLLDRLVREEEAFHTSQASATVAGDDASGGGGGGASSIGKGNMGALRVPAVVPPASGKATATATTPTATATATATAATATTTATAAATSASEVGPTFSARYDRLVKCHAAYARLTPLQQAVDLFGRWFTRSLLLLISHPILLPVAEADEGGVMVHSPDGAPV
jgi:hypothetical protein